eukprot:scaffold82672_cov75-Phaeocystis_antarctica.AAC.6
MPPPPLASAPTHTPTPSSPGCCVGWEQSLLLKPACPPLCLSSRAESRGRTRTPRRNLFYVLVLRSSSRRYILLHALNGKLLNIYDGTTT